jgi:hypothetical protein
MPLKLSTLQEEARQKALMWGNDDSNAENRPVYYGICEKYKIKITRYGYTPNDCPIPASLMMAQVGDIYQNNGSSEICVESYWDIKFFASILEVEPT